MMPSLWIHRRIAPTAMSLLLTACGLSGTSCVEPKPGPSQEMPVRSPGAAAAPDGTPSAGATPPNLLPGQPPVGAAAADDDDRNLTIEVREEKWPNGSPMRRVVGYVDEEGEFVRHGEAVEHYDSGLQKSVTQWRHGLLHGSKRTWYLNGQAWSTGQYVDGKSDGVWRRWHQSGGRHSEWTMVRDVWHGTYAEWHENGFKRMEVEFVNGVRQGPMRLWDEQGVLVTTTDFVDGVEQP
ncbi:MAG: hypothetical protein AABZ12_01235 [Planctomycetota bacterium]